MACIVQMLSLQYTPLTHEDHPQADEKPALPHLSEGQQNASLK